MQAISREAFYRVNVGYVLLFALAVFVLFDLADLADLDRLFSDLLYDPVTGVFPLEHNTLFEKITHKWARVIPDWTGEIAIIGSLLSFIWPRLAPHPQSRVTTVLEAVRIAPVLRFATRYRRDFLFVVLAFSLSTGVIHYLKSHTGVYCPVETTLYGGKEIRMEWFHNFSLWQKAGPGRCWPGGHASGGFSMLALYFIARRYRWQHTRKVLMGALLLGFVFGTTRVLQGWHFMSHTFWSGIFVWLSTLMVALALYGRERLSQPLAAPLPGVAEYTHAGCDKMAH
jgi:membrane-associated PAP2 superfamily phosphatase